MRHNRLHGLFLVVVVARKTACRQAVLSCCTCAAIACARAQRTMQAKRRVVIVAPSDYACYADADWCADAASQVETLVQSSALVFVWANSRALAHACLFGARIPGCVYAGVVYRVFSVDKSTMEPVSAVGASTNARVLELLLFVRGDGCADTEHRLVWDRYIFATTRGELFVPQNLIRTLELGSLGPLSTDDIFSPVTLATDRPPEVLANLTFVDSDMWHVVCGTVHGILAGQLGDMTNVAVLCSDPASIATHAKTAEWECVMLPVFEEVDANRLLPRAALRLMKEAAVQVEQASASRLLG